MRSEFRELRAYQLPVAIANDLHAVVSRWPSADLWSLGVQLMRAIDSIGANIAEGAGRWHRQDQRRFVLMARGSLYETEHWLACAEARGLLDAGWSQRLEEAARALNGLLKTWPTG
jgi:four helix bundle protein